METTRFVEVTANELFGLLDGIGESVKGLGGSYVGGTVGREVYVDIMPPKRPGFVRVYTSCTRGAEVLRECGDDAIRVCVMAKVKDKDGHLKRDKPLSEGRKVLRTAPKGEHDARVATFLERLKTIVREAYVASKEVPVCRECGNAMAERHSNYGMFLGCTLYPECKSTKSR